MEKVNIKALMQVLIDAECLSDVLEEIAIDGFEIGYLYATSSEFKSFADECISIHERLDEVFRESDNAGICQNALGFYYIEITQSNITDRYNEIMAQIKNQPPIINEVKE